MTTVNSNETMLTLLKKYIDEQLDEKCSDVNPSPSANNSELKSGYEELSSDSDEDAFVTIKSAWPKGDTHYIAYVIYMVKYDGNYWIVTYPGDGSSIKYGINQYFYEDY
tara:strand:+ start:1164 stop:1490 length:327 start_codon:yes stop_codon:yes gene_type:complete